MGSQFSKENSTEQSNIQTYTNSITAKKTDKISFDKSISSIGNIYNDDSNYKGIIIDKAEIRKNLFNNNYINEYIEKEKPKPIENMNNLVKFYWEEGGNDVYITGTFCDWKKRIKMNKNKNNIFEQELLLDKGKYEFKFIVDNEWKCSSYYPQIKDNRGIINNYLDNTNLNNIKSFKINKLEENNANINNSQDLLRKNFEYLKNNYNNIFPYKEQFNEEAPKIPDVFEILIDLNNNTNQKYIGNIEYLGFPLINWDDSFKSIIQPFHSYLNHMFIHENINNINIPKKKQENNSNSNTTKKKINFIGINCNIKIKNKYLSIVYYTPLNKT